MNMVLNCKKTLINMIDACKDLRFKEIFGILFFCAFISSYLFGLGNLYWQPTEKQILYQNILSEAWFYSHPPEKLDIVQINYATIDKNGYPYLLAKIVDKENCFYNYTQYIQKQGWKEKSNGVFFKTLRGKDIYLSLHRDTSTQTFTVTIYGTEIVR